MNITWYAKFLTNKFSYQERKYKMGSQRQFNPKEKYKYFVAVMYPESMVDNWQEEIGDLLQAPYCYCIHDKDKDGHDGDRKTHVHVMIAFNNTTTWKHALTIFQQLQPNITYCQPVFFVRHMYEYLIHNTEDCKKKKKYLYDISERISGNHFDIGAYEQISIEEKEDMLFELADYIVANDITNFADFYMDFCMNFGKEYRQILRTYSGFLERIVKGVYLKNIDTKLNN